MQQFIRFGLVGVVSTVIDMLVLKALLFYGAHILVAGGIGFFAGFTNGYYFNSRYVFSRFSKKQYSRYLLVSLLALILTETILFVLHDQLGVTDLVAKLVAVGLVFFSNFFLSKYWAFR